VRGPGLLAPLPGDPALERYQPLYAAHAELLGRAGDAECVERAELERRLGALR
jgi:RNA polymerase sigma-70 factor (ECF subfamily)